MEDRSSSDGNHVADLNAILGVEGGAYFSSIRAHSVAMRIGIDWVERKDIDDCVAVSKGGES